MGTLIYLLLFFILFRFFLRYVLPIFQITRAASRKMREMQDQMNNARQGNNPAPPRNGGYKPKEGEYIDYEEIK